MVDNSAVELESIAAAKARLRTAVRAGRSTRSEHDRGVAAQALAAVALTALSDLRRCAAYVSVDVEPGTGALLDQLAARGVEVLLPVVAARGALEWAAYAGRGALRAGAFGLLEPVGRRVQAATLRTVDAVLVPALAVDRSGNRLGRGAGFYDRFLRTVPTGVLVAAVVYDDEVLAAVPIEPHDQPVTAALTPTRLIRLPE